jgi:spore coat protein CotH
MGRFTGTCIWALLVLIPGCTDDPGLTPSKVEANGTSASVLAPLGIPLIGLPASVPRVSITILPENFRSLNRSPYRADDVIGTFTDETGELYEDVALNFRGAYALKQMMESGRARNWKVKFAKDKDYLERREWNFNYEPKLRQKLAYDLMNFAGVPASKPQHVILSVNGVEHGLYLQFEDPDNKGWLKAHFSDHKGDLYKVGYDAPDDVPHRRFGELTYLGADQTAYKNSYNKKKSRTDVPKDDLSTIVSFTKELNSISDQQIPAFFEATIDLDALISYLVVSNFIVHWDGYPGRAKNYWIYQNPSTGKWTMVPWDMDAVFEDPWVWKRDRGSNASIFIQFDKQAPYRRFNDEGIERPLVRRLMKHQQYRERYIARYRELTTTILNESFLIHHMAALTSLIRKTASPSDVANLDNDNARIGRFIRKRSKHVHRELSRQ